MTIFGCAHRAACGSAFFQTNRIKHARTSVWCSNIIIKDARVEKTDAGQYCTALTHHVHLLCCCFVHVVLKNVMVHYICSIWEKQYFDQMADPVVVTQLPLKLLLQLLCNNASISHISFSRLRGINNDLTLAVQKKSITDIRCLILPVKF